MVDELPARADMPCSSPTVRDGLLLTMVLSFTFRARGVGAPRARASPQALVLCTMSWEEGATFKRAAHPSPALDTFV